MYVYIAVNRQQRWYTSEEHTRIYGSGNGEQTKPENNRLRQKVVAMVTDMLFLKIASRLQKTGSRIKYNYKNI